MSGINKSNFLAGLEQRKRQRLAVIGRIAAREDPDANPHVAWFAALPVDHQQALRQSYAEAKAAKEKNRKR